MKINRIFLFGDSWIEGQGTFDFIETIHNPNQAITTHEFREPEMDFQQLREWRRKNSWEKFLRKYTNAEIINHAVQGTNNYQQYHHLNSVLKELKSTDLCLFGFTSKYRDTAQQINYAYQDIHTSPINRKNPLYSPITYEKEQLGNDMFKGVFEYNSEIEMGFTKQHLQDFFVKVFDERVYENIAQSNYLFYQNWIKANGFGKNVLFFDIFEKYIDENYINEYYDVDETMYITYKKANMNEVLREYERNTITETSPHSIWEYYDAKFPKNILHPNQLGYEHLVDWLWETVLSIRYKFI
jgi:hypothetical protein